MSITPLSCLELESIFSDLFFASESTRLVGCVGDPFYAARTKERPIAEIRYVTQSLPSALHELAHWCVAGAKRRQQDDYGYWYNPDGRTLEEQRVFECLEVKPQAMEWLLSVAVGRSFVVSCDNLRGSPYDLDSFRIRIMEQAIKYLDGPRPKRFDCLLDRLIDAGASHDVWNAYWSNVFQEKMLPSV